MAHRLLLVDDEPRNLALLEGHLAPLGYEIVHATGGREALHAFAKVRPSIVLLDLMMPGLDGIDVLTHIRAQPGPYVPVILVTAHAEREHRLRGLEAGADEFLEKPIDAPILLTRVRTLLALKDSRDALAARNEALERLQRQQRELTAFVVHDLKNPLSVVWTTLDWARDHAPAGTGDFADALDDAIQASRQLRSMIEDLLVISRLEESAFPLHPEAITLRELIDEVISLYRRVAHERNVDISAPADLDLRVRGDRTLLRRVLENILDNSLRYTPARGRVAIDARGDDDVRIAVSNSGPPIPMDLRERIFEKFARGDESTGSRGHAGLGLYFCKQAIEAQGGQIEVVQTAEWPTSFVLHLPAS